MAEVYLNRALDSRVGEREHLDKELMLCYNGEQDCKKQKGDSMPERIPDTGPKPASSISSDPDEVDVDHVATEVREDRAEEEELSRFRPLAERVAAEVAADGRSLDGSVLHPLLRALRDAYEMGRTGQLGPQFGPNDAEGRTPSELDEDYDGYGVDQGDDG